MQQANRADEHEERQQKRCQNEKLKMREDRASRSRKRHRGRILQCGVELVEWHGPNHQILERPD